MKLTDLNPRWLSPNIFVFQCPCCRKIDLSVKNVVLSRLEQRAVFVKEYGEEGWCEKVICTKIDCAWTVSGRDFATMTVTPSIDASDSRHWHGHITNGEIK